MVFLEPGTEGLLTMVEIDLGWNKSITITSSPATVLTREFNR